MDSVGGRWCGAASMRLMVGLVAVAALINTPLAGPPGFARLPTAGPEIYAR
jgi:hypothetical protein